MFLRSNTFYHKDSQYMIFTRSVVSCLQILVASLHVCVNCRAARLSERMFTVEK